MEKSFLNFDEDFGGEDHLDSTSNDAMMVGLRASSPCAIVRFDCSSKEMMRTIAVNRSLQSLIRDSLTECDLVLKKINRNTRKLNNGSPLNTGVHQIKTPISPILPATMAMRNRRNKINPVEGPSGYGYGFGGAITSKFPSFTPKTWSTLERHSLASAIRQQNEQMEIDHSVNFGSNIRGIRGTLDGGIDGNADVGFQDEIMFNLESKESCFEPTNLSSSASKTSQATNINKTATTAATSTTSTTSTKNNYGSIGLEYNLDNINWEKIASQVNVKSSGGTVEKSAMDCRIQWTMLQHPLLNKEPFDDNERKRLIELAKEEVTASWDEISNLLSTNRTGCQCLGEWKRIMQNVPLSGNLRKDQTSKRKWTQREDEVLTELVTIYGDTDSWIDISEMFTIQLGEHADCDISDGGRSAISCRFRWEKSLNPLKAKGRWTEEEDEWLRVGIEVHGDNPIGGWSLISAYVPSRTDVQCRERWLKVLDPSLVKEPWSAEEDSIFYSLMGNVDVDDVDGNDDDAIDHNNSNNSNNDSNHNHKGMHWSLIAKEHFPNRNDRQCRRRFLQLLKTKKRK